MDERIDVPGSSLLVAKGEHETRAVGLGRLAVCRVTAEQKSVPTIHEIEKRVSVLEQRGAKTEEE